MTKNRPAILTITRKTRILISCHTSEKITTDSKMVFSIVNLIKKSNKFKDVNYNIGDKLRIFDNDRIQPEQRIRKLDQTDERRPTLNRGTEKQSDTYVIVYILEFI